MLNLETLFVVCSGDGGLESVELVDGHVGIKLVLLLILIEML